MTGNKARARAQLERALELYERCGPGTYGRREAIKIRLPLAIEAMVDARLDERLRARNFDLFKDGEPE